MTAMESIGQRLIFLMESKDMTQKTLADKIEISKQSLYKYTHDLCEPRSEIIARMAVALDTTADYIVGLTKDPAPVRRNGELEQKAKKESELLARIRRLSPEGYARLEERLDMLLELENK